MQAISKKITLPVIISMFIAASASAADGNSPIGSGVNSTLFALVTLMIILVFVIGVLASILAQLGTVVKDKAKKEKEEKSKGAGITALLFLLFLLPATTFAADRSETVKFPNAIDGIPFAEFYTIVSVICLELLVIFGLVSYIRMILRVIKGVPEHEQAHKAIKQGSWFWDKFNKAAAPDQEREILMDHNYDGIQELDNSLPPWWKYGFYLSIVVAFIYVYRFHVSHDGQSQREEFVAEMEQGEADKAAYLATAANNVDETNVTLLTDGAAIALGKEVFMKNCVACHLADGGGSVGPNLTDDYWMHGGSLKDVFKSVKYGWQEKGMKSWKDDLSPIQIQQVVSFIRTLKGTKPATPKDPQGDLYAEVASAPVPQADSTSK